jgi:hypothetical protein
MPADQGQLSQKLKDFQPILIYYLRLCLTTGKVGMNFSVIILEVSDRRWSVKWAEIKLP